MRSNHPPRRVIAALVLASATLLAPAAAEAATKGPKVSVMTRNIYLGGNIAAPIGSANAQEFAQKNQGVWDTVVKTDFPSRSKLLGKEIAQKKPDLIGLQEVALWRSGPVNDPAAATSVRYDFLKILRAELKRRGLKYRVGVIQQEADVEGPTVSDGDVRLTMRDVILVKRKKGLKVRRGRGANYKANIQVPVPVSPGTLKVLRGYTYVDATANGVKFRFVNTHLEAFLPSTRLAQAQELIARGGPMRTKQPLILVGDLNSDPNGEPAGEGDAAPYKAIVRFGMKDAWTKANPGKKGYACCTKREDVLDPPPFPADHRIDHILFKGKIRSLRASVVGIDPRNRTASGLWPSDHGGVVATLRLPRKR